MYKETWERSIFRYFNQFCIFIFKAQSGKKENIRLKSSKGNIMKSCVYYPEMLVFILKAFRNCRGSLGRRDRHTEKITLGE